MLFQRRSGIQPLFLVGDESTEYCEVLGLRFFFGLGFLFSFCLVCLFCFGFLFVLVGFLFGWFFVFLLEFFCANLGNNEHNIRLYKAAVLEPQLSP